MNPVVGWLVCIEGAEKGQDYKIHSEKNFIGRSEETHINIEGDKQISRCNHVVVSYNAKERVSLFLFLSAGNTLPGNMRRFKRGSGLKS